MEQDESKFVLNVSPKFEDPSAPRFTIQHEPGALEHQPDDGVDIINANILRMRIRRKKSEYTNIRARVELRLDSSDEDANDDVFDVSPKFEDPFAPRYTIEHDPSASEQGDVSKGGNGDYADDDPFGYHFPEVMHIIHEELLFHGRMENEANMPHQYFVYGEFGENQESYRTPSYQDGPEEWCSKNRFVPPENAIENLLEERQDLFRQEAFIKSEFLCGINEFRNQKSSQTVSLTPMSFSDELTEVAKSVWMERTSVPDGFILLPEYRITRNGNTYGCMVFCTPKTDPVSNHWLGRHVANYWILDTCVTDDLLAQSAAFNSKAFETTGLETAHFFPRGAWSRKPVLPPNYPYDHSRNQGLFADQLQLPECLKVGIYFDMAQLTDCFVWNRVYWVKNVTCLVAVFEKPVPERNYEEQNRLQFEIQLEKASSSKEKPDKVAPRMGVFFDSLP